MVGSTGRGHPGVDGPVAPRRRPRTAPRSRATAAVHPRQTTKRERRLRWLLGTTRDPTGPAPRGGPAVAARARARRAGPGRGRPRAAGGLGSRRSRAAGCPSRASTPPMPQARFALAAPLAAAIPGEAELLDTWLVERLPAWRVREALGRAACRRAGGWSTRYDVWLGEAPLPGRVAASVYRADVPGGRAGVGPTPSRRPRAGARGAPTLPRERRRARRPSPTTCGRSSTRSTSTPTPDGGAIVRMTLRHDPERGVGRPDETLAALGETGRHAAGAARRWSGSGSCSPIRRRRPPPAPRRRPGAPPVRGPPARSLTVPAVRTYTPRSRPR